MINKDFKKFCFEILTGLLIVVLVVLVANSTNWFRYHERNSTPANLWAELLENQQSNKEAILILGNSHSYVLNPEIIDSITGFKPYCLCYPAANVEKLYWLLYNALDHIKPQFIVIETKAFINWKAKSNELDALRLRTKGNKFPFFNSFPHFINYAPWSQKKIETIYNLMLSDLKEAPYAFSGSSIRNHDIIEVDPELILEAMMRPKARRNFNSGFFKSKYKPISDSLLFLYDKRKPIPDEKIDSLVVVKLDAIIELASEKGIEVLFYESPMYVKHLAPQIERFEQINELTQKYNATYLNLALVDSLVATPKYYQNTFAKNQHLTLEGSDVISKIIASEIIKLK